jgi:hypothetical protein
MTNYKSQNLAKTTLWQHFMDNVVCFHPFSTAKFWTTFYVWPLCVELTMIFIFNKVFETLVEICVQYCLCGIICGHILKFLHQAVRISNLSFSLCVQKTYLRKVVVGVCLLGNHTKVILCLVVSWVNMLVKIENDVFKKGYKG